MAAVHASLSYAQEGEDLILRRIFGQRSTGTYVDVGAHHPWRFSNTFHFYQRGWSGVNIDATPGSMARFRKRRPRDTNLELAIGEEAGELTLIMFDEPALNTLDEAVARSRPDHYRRIGTRPVEVRRLDDVLDECLHGSTIDFLNVDVEGHELEVLRSNDWNRFRPECVLVECLDASVEAAQHSPAGDFLAGVGYELVAKTANTLVFRLRPTGPGAPGTA